MRLIHSLAAAALLVTSGAPAVAKPSNGAAELAKAIEGRVPGKPVDCIPLSATRTSKVIDGTAVIYNWGRTIYVNQPKVGAENLRQWNIMVTKPTSSQFCRLDVVHMVDQTTHMQTGFISLGQFVPYTRR